VTMAYLNVGFFCLEELRKIATSQSEWPIPQPRFEQTLLECKPEASSLEATCLVGLLFRTRDVPVGISVR
jgi:hypothetical protein